MNHLSSRFQDARLIARPLALAIAMMMSAPAPAALLIPDTPLVTGSQVPPNIMFILDDSGSMGWNTMPGAKVDWRIEFPYDGVLVDQIRYMSANINTLWYDPTTTYTPGTKAAGGSYDDLTLTTLRDNGYQSTATDAALWVTATKTLGSSNAWPVSAPALSSSTIYPVFYVLTAGASPAVNSNYVRYEFRNAGAPTNTTIELRKCAINGDGGRGACTVLATSPFKNASGGYRTVAQEATNFANWFSYYRTRLLMAKTSASIAFGELKENYRIGFDTIGPSRNTFPIPVGTDGGLFRGQNRATWFSRLFGATDNGHTPLIPALDRAGQYYSDVSASGPWGPESGTAQTSCRPSFTILTTDGYWNDGAASFGNEDNTAGATITGEGGASYTYVPAKPYADAWSTTLADVAMHYWKTDLRPQLKNDVPVSSKDPAFWQHMVTFGISIGMTGSLDPTSDLPALTSGAKSWPNPMDREDLHRIDDLWHATVNSRGSFVAARNPVQFSTALRAALLDISARTANVSNVSSSSASLTTSTYLYQASFRTGSASGSWSGDVAAYKLDATGNLATAHGSAVPTWRAAENVPLPAARKIYFLRGSDTVEFNVANLSSAQKTLLGGDDVVNYLRGDQSKEQANGGTLRNRYAVSNKAPLGDVVDSSPVFDASTNTVYFGANDGMLHAVDAASGVERFAIVPTPLFSTLRDLSDPLYPHHFYVDGEIAIANKSLLGKSILVAALGRGGKAVFAVDVTDIANPKVLWEYTDAELGLVLGRPIVARTNEAGTWAAIFGNGVNSSSERSQLYALNLETGALLSRIDTHAGGSNGMFGTRGWDDDGNGTLDYVYAGDRRGNLWKFDLTAASATQWKTALGSIAAPAPMFVAKDASDNPQPITGGLTIALNPRHDSPSYGSRWVFFGTGQFLTEADSSDKSVQSWYGVIDSGAAVSGARSTVLRQRTIATEDLLAAPKKRKFSKAQPNDMAGKLGWYVDLTGASNTAYGERAIATPQLLSPKVLNLSTYIPDADVCQPGGTGWVNVIDPFTGGALSSDFFGNDASSIDTGIGGPGKSLLIGSGRLITGGGDQKGDGRCSGGAADCCKTVNGISSCPVNLDPATGRISWREMVDTR